MIADENAAILYIFINLEEGNFMIEFEGFVSHDFDFFKKRINWQRKSITI